MVKDMNIKDTLCSAEESICLERVATICKFIVNDPETHIDSIPLVIKALEGKNLKYRVVVMLSLVKVFKNIIPLYRVRLYQKKVKGPGGCEYVRLFDKKVLQYYTLFVKKVLEYNDVCSYKAACHLLVSADHFNLADKLASKVLRGTRHEGTRSLCKATLLQKIREANRLEAVYCIISEMQNLNFHPSTLEVLLEVNTFAECTPKDSFTKIKTTDEKKIIQGITDSIMRIYIQVLRDKNFKFYIFVFLGLQKHKLLIKEELYEGLYILLTKALHYRDRSTKLACISCIFELFHDRNYDIIEAVNGLYDLLLPIEKKIESSVIYLIEKLFLSKRQPTSRARNIMQRLMQLCLIKFVPDIKAIIDKLKHAYHIDFRDMHIIGTGSYAQDADRIDQTIEKPFYEYFLYKQGV